MALTKIGLKILKDSFRTIISGSFRGELSSSASTFIGGGVSGSSTSTGSFGRVEAAGVVFADSFKSVTGGTTIDFNDDVSLTGNLTATGNVSGSITSTGSFGRLQIDSTGSFGRVITSTADINGGTIDGITSLTAGGDLDIGAHGFRASTLTADSQTSGRVAIYSTAGLLSEDSDLTFSGATLSATNVTTTGTIKDFASVSGSYVSTGSVGRIQTRAADIGTITGTTLSTTGNISGSTTSTGSFGRLQTQQGNASIGGNIVTLGGNLTTAGTLTTQNNNVTINAAGAARTLTLNESLTIGDGHDGTITFGAASKTLTVENTSLLNQDLTTDASPTFAGATITGTLTVQEVHTEFESASILFTSGSTKFGNSTDDVHNVTGSMKITGSFQVDNGTLTAGTVDINGGTIDGITSLTAGGDLDIGSHDFRAATLTADGLTSGRVTFAGTNGVLSDDSDLTFATATLSATNLTSTGTIKNFGLVSGSFVSTGSVGRIQTRTADVGIITGTSLTTSGNISGSVTSTGSFGQGEFPGRLIVGTTDTKEGTLVVQNSTRSELVIKTSATATDTEAALEFKIDTGTSNDENKKGAIVYKDVGSNGVGDLFFLVDSNNDGNNATVANDAKMVIKNAGKVGIGTNNPIRPLSVGYGAAKTSTDTAYAMAIQSNESANQAALQFYVVGGASAAVRRFQIQSGEVGVANSGIIEFQPDGGDVRFPNGILFGSDTAAANELDDYEEGTITPTLLGAGSNPTQVYNSRGGFYTKIGNRVFYTIRVEMNGSGVSAGSGIMKIGGLPFTVHNDVNNSGCCSVGLSGGFNTGQHGGPTGGIHSANETHVNLTVYDNDGGNIGSVVDADAADVTNGSILIVSGHYITHT